MPTGRVQPAPEESCATMRDLEGTLSSPPDSQRRLQQALPMKTAEPTVYQVPAPTEDPLSSVDAPELCPDFSSRGGWSHAVQRGRGVVVDELPGEWQIKLRLLAGEDGCVTLEKLATAAKRQEAATKVAGGKIDVRGFPEHLHVVLDAFDADGNGEVDAEELQRAALLYSDSQNSAKGTVRAIIGLLITTIALCSVLAGLTYAVIEGTKEVRATGARTPEGQVLLTVGHGDNKDTPVTTMIPDIDIPLGALAYIPEILWRTPQLKLVLDFSVPATLWSEEVYDKRTFHITGFDMMRRDGNHSVTMYTSSGDTIHLTPPVDGVLRHRNETEEYFCGICATCGVMNIAHTPAVDRGLKAMRAAIRLSNATCQPPAQPAARRASPQHEYTIGGTPAKHQHTQTQFLFDTGDFSAQCDNLCNNKCGNGVFESCNTQSKWECEKAYFYDDDLPINENDYNTAVANGHAGWVHMTRYVDCNGCFVCLEDNCKGWLTQASKNIFGSSTSFPTYHHSGSDTPRPV